MKPRLGLEIFLIAAAAILLEVSYTRVFSFKLVYYFTYVIIGIALLGVGAGGVLVAFFPWLRRLGPARLIGGCALLGGASVGLGYLIVARTQVNAFDMLQAISIGDRETWGPEVLRLLSLCLVLFVPFLCAGTAIAAIFAVAEGRINRLYFADLLGAGLGCAVAVPLMTHLTPPGVIMLAGMLFAAAGLRLTRTGARDLFGPLVVTAVLAGAGAVLPGHLPDPVADKVKTMSPQQRHSEVRFSRWSPVFRVDVVEDSIAAKTGLMLSHDGMWGSMLPRYDGNPASLVRYDTDTRSIPFSILPERARVAIIGAAGGNEILASLHFDAGHITAVELNPVTVSLLTTHFKDYTGRMVDDERVTLINAEGRAFFEGTDDHWDLVWFVAPDSYAAMNAATSGAFVLSESYLYTAEMIEESLAHLTPDGFVCAQFGEIAFDQKPNRTTRYLATAREALRRLGVSDPARHLLVATTTGFAFTNATVLVKREAFTADDIDRVTASLARIDGGKLRYAWTLAAPDSPVGKAITLSPEALDAWYPTYPFDVRPITDDAPFFWHFVRFGDVLKPSRYPGGTAMEEGLGERLIILLLAIVTAMAFVFLLLPLAFRPSLRTVPHKLRAAVYFAALGFGFMFFEVTLIQHLTLFLGYPTYSLTVTLFALLVSTGLGSLLSEGVVRHRDRMLLRLAVALLALGVFYLLGLEPLLARCFALPFAIRIAVAGMVLVPLGLCLGVFMPLGLRTVAALSPHPEEYVAWSWAVNGFCSVVASVLATILSMTFGFDAVLLIALGVYAVGLLALRSIPAPQV